MKLSLPVSAENKKWTETDKEAGSADENESRSVSNAMAISVAMRGVKLMYEKL